MSASGVARCGESGGVEGPHPGLDQSEDNHLSWTFNAPSCSHPSCSGRLWERAQCSLHRRLPGPPVPRSHRLFFRLYLVSQQLLAGPVALPVCQEAFFFKAHFLSVPASFPSPGPASLGPIRLDHVVTLPLGCRQGPGCGKFRAKWPAHQKLLGVSNLSIETSQVHILGITHKSEQNNKTPLLSYEAITKMATGTRRVHTERALGVAHSVVLPRETRG